MSLDIRNREVRRGLDREAAAAAQRAAELQRAADAAVRERQLREIQSQAATMAWERTRPQRQAEAAASIGELERRLAAVAVDDERHPLPIRRRARGFLLTGNPDELPYVCEDEAAGEYHELTRQAAALLARLGELELGDEVAERVDRLECRSWAAFLRRVRQISGEE